MQRREPRSHRFKRGPHLDHLDDLALRLANDVDAAPRQGPDEALLLEQREGFADGRSADPERGSQLPLVEPQLLLGVVDVHVRNRSLEQGVGLVAQAGRIEGCEGQANAVGSALENARRRIHFRTVSLEAYRIRWLAQKAANYIRQPGPDLYSPLRVRMGWPAMQEVAPPRQFDL